MTVNRKRTSSADQHVAVATNAQVQIRPPKRLTRNAKKHFREIIARRANIDWNPHDISTVVILSRLMDYCDIQQNKLDEEIDIDPNPRQKTVNEVTSKIIQFRRTLNIHQAGDHPARTEAKRFEANAHTQNVVRLAVQNSDLLD